eukprot:scaffold176432_cov45-Prasinocladus_malaysianus.AAC.2
MGHQLQAEHVNVQGQDDGVLHIIAIGVSVFVHLLLTPAAARGEAGHREAQERGIGAKVAHNLKRVLAGVELSVPGSLCGVKGVAD